MNKPLSFLADSLVTYQNATKVASVDIDARFRDLRGSQVSLCADDSSPSYQVIIHRGIQRLAKGMTCQFTVQSGYIDTTARELVLTGVEAAGSVVRARIAMAGINRLREP